jgi:hypothetical protein
LFQFPDTLGHEPDTALQACHSAVGTVLAIRPYRLLPGRRRP